MKNYSLVMALTLLATSVNAAELKFSSVIDAIAIKSNQDFTNQGWDSIDKIKGVKWAWPYYESGAHDSTMKGTTKVGKDKNPNIGATTIEVEGMRSMISTITINIGNENVDLSAFGKGKTKQIKTSCDDDSASYNLGFYSFEKKGYKPVFISKEESWGASGSGTVEFKLGYTVEDIFPSQPQPCTILK